MRTSIDSHTHGFDGDFLSSLLSDILRPVSSSSPDTDATDDSRCQLPTAVLAVALYVLKRGGLV